MAALETSTVDTLSELRLSEITKDWVDQVWESDFCEVCELPDVLLEEIADKEFYKEALKNVLDVVRQWCECDPESQPLGTVLYCIHFSIVVLDYCFVTRKL